MPKSKFYINCCSSCHLLGYAIMQRKSHWWQRLRKVADFYSWENREALLLCYQLNHQGELPPLIDYCIDIFVQEQFTPTDPEHSYCVCAEYAIPYGEEEGTEQLLPPPIIPPRTADEPVPVSGDRCYYTRIDIAHFIDQDEDYAKRCAEELLEHLQSALHDERAYFEQRAKTAE